MKPKISFCTTCMNRLWQFKKTIFSNLELIKKSNCELCLVNYNSTDGLHEFIKNNFQKELQKGIIKYIHTKKPRYYHSSHAKNIAHKMATSDIVFNLDCDNFITKESIDFILANLKSGVVIHEFTGWNDGTCGRICMTREDFLNLRGYNEELLLVSYQDIDLLERAKVFGLKVITPFFIYPIKRLFMKNPYSKLTVVNTQKQKLENTPYDDHEKINAINKRKSNLKIQKIKQSKNKMECIQEIINPNGFGEIEK